MKAVDVGRKVFHLFSTVGGRFFLNCNYEVSDYTISSQFYQELLL